MRKLAMLLPLLLTACAEQAPVPDQKNIQTPTVQMTVVTTSLNQWPYTAPITFAIPDNLVYSQNEGKAWLGLIKKATQERLQALGLKEATPETANIWVGIGILGENEDADSLVFNRLGLDPGVTTSKKGTIALVIKDRQSNVKLWSAALQASSDMPIRAQEVRERTASSLIEQMTMRLPQAQ